MEQFWVDIDWQIWLRLMGGCIRVKWLGKAGRVSIAFGLQRGRFSNGITTGLQGRAFAGVWAVFA